MTPSNAASGTPCLEDLLEHGDFVRSLARSLVVDVHSADDLVQETWIVALRNPPRHSGALRGWLSTVVRNLARRSRRSRSRRRNHEQLSYEPRTSPTPAEALSQDSVAIELARAVDSLDPIYRDVVTLRYFDEIAPREIASRLELPVETVRTRLKRATDRLRQRLDENHEGDRTRWLGAVAMLAGSPELAPPSGLERGGTAPPRATSAPGATGTIGARVVGLSIAATLALATVGIFVVLSSSPRSTAEGAVASGTPPRPTTPSDEAVRRPREHVGAPSPPSAPAAASEARGLRIRGRVLDASERAVAGATVFVSEPGRPDDERSSVTTDARGRFELDAVDPGSWIGARAAGWRTSKLRYARDPARGSGELTLRLGARELLVRGTVRDRRGHPVANATVRPVRAGRPLPIWSLDGRAELEAIPAAATTDDDGRFEIGGLGPGRVPLVVRSAGHAPHSSNPRAQRADAAPLCIVLDPGSDTSAPPDTIGARRITGRVAGAAPVAQRVVALVALEPPAEGPVALVAPTAVDPSEHWTTTRADGSFELPLPASVTGTVTIGLFDGEGPPHGAPLSRARVDSNEGSIELVAPAEPDTRIAGTVCDDAGGRLEEALLLFDYGSGTEPVLTTIDATTGRFELDRAPLGSARAFVWARGFVPRSAGSIDVTPGENPDVRLRVARNGTLRGRVDGVAPDEVWMLRVAGAAHRPFDARSDAPAPGFELASDGTFAVEHLPPGDYSLSARSGARSTGLVPMRIDPGAVTLVDLSLNDGSPVDLELHFPPLPGIEGTVVATIRSDAGRLYRQGTLPWSRVDSDCVPMAVTLPAGGYAVTAVVGDDEVLLRGHFTVAGPSAAPVQVHLR